jgi:hypothetical protein
MSIARISDSLAGDLPRLLLEAATANSKGLDSSDFKDTLTIRDYTDKYLPVLSIISFADTYKELSKYTELTEEYKSSFMNAVREGVNRSKSIVRSESSIVLKEKMQIIALDNKLSEVQKAIKIRNLFSKGYVLSDSDQISPDSVIFVVSNFLAVGTRINKYVNESLKKSGISETLGKYLDLGHSSVRYGDSSTYAFNSPKLTAVLFDITTTNPSSFVSGSINLNQAASIYVKKTEQIEQSVTVEKSFGDGFVNIFVQFGGSIVTLENSLENQERGRTLEKAEKFGTNKAVLQKLVARFKDIKDTAIKGQYNTSELGRIIRNLFKYSSSPSGADHIVHQIISSILGKKVEGFKQKRSASKKKKVTTTTKIKLPTNLNIGKKHSPKVSLPNGTPINLASLQSLLDALLIQKVKDNMGDGSRRDVLNLRTGRLAESAKVERLSESRAGMITAFYTYMKNPYATFSAGGMQQMPRSRDPKALISKSIREIAATQVGNRLRAVLV